MDALPTQTLYVTNLPDKPKKEEMRQLLYALFSPHGRVIDVVHVRRERLRGQAWVVFADVASAAAALRELQAFPFYERPLRLAYALTKSDAAAKADGSWKKDLRTRRQPGAPGGAAARAAAAAAAGGGSGGAPAAGAPKAAGAAADAGAPSRTLFVEGLPAATTEAMLALLFQQFPGYEGVRLPPGRPGIAFADFGGELQAGVALAGLQGFRVTPEAALRLSYAKQ